MSEHPLVGPTTYLYRPDPDVCLYQPFDESLLPNNPIVRQVVRDRIRDGWPVDRIIDDAEQRLLSEQNKIWTANPNSRKLAVFGLLIPILAVAVGVTITIVAAELAVSDPGHAAEWQTAQLPPVVVLIVVATWSALHAVIKYGTDPAEDRQQILDQTRAVLDRHACTRLLSSEVRTLSVCTPDDRDLTVRLLQQLSQLRDRIAVIRAGGKTLKPDLRQAQKRLVAAEQKLVNQLGQIAEQGRQKADRDRQNQVWQQLSETGDAVTAVLNDPEPDTIPAPARKPRRGRWETYPGGMP